MTKEKGKDKEDFFLPARIPFFETVFLSFPQIPHCVSFLFSVN